jgi:hypothetical protein
VRFRLVSHPGWLADRPHIVDIRRNDSIPRPRDCHKSPSHPTSRCIRVWMHLPRGGDPCSRLFFPPSRKFFISDSRDQVLYDQKPYERYNRNIILISQAILKHESPHKWPDGPCPLDLFISQCWTPDPSNRPTINEVCAMFGSVLQEEDDEEMIIITDSPPKPDNNNGREFQQSNPPCGAASRFEEPTGPAPDPA